MKLFDYLDRPVKLVNRTTGEEVKLGDEITTFRGDTQRCKWIEPPHKPAASGKVNNYYASVFNLEFVILWEARPTTDGATTLHGGSL